MNQRATDKRETISGLARTQGSSSKLEGRICARCGRILTTSERVIGQHMPPAVCTECTHGELARLEDAIEAAAPARRRERWATMVRRAARRVAARREAALAASLGAAGR